jgi:deazaflavin-dependent oxidoreductase (nitroreductase family)
MWFNPIIEWLLKSPLQRMISGNTMLIHYTGRKSGKIYHLPVSYLRVNDKLLTISSKQRTWWRNFRGGAAVTVLLKGKMVPAHAQVVEDDQGVAEGLTAFIGGNPQTARMFGVNLGADGQLETESLNQATKGRVIVDIKLG